MRLLLFAVLVAGSLARPSEKVCKLGDWSQWSACTTAKLCNPPQSGKSFHKEPAVWDEGRIHMKKLMALKEKEAEKRAACMESGECPEVFRPTSQSYAACVNGMAGEWPCENVDLLAFLDFVELGYDAPAARGNDIWGYHDDVTGDEYAVVGLNGGSSFVRVTDPLNPFVCGFLPGRGNPSSWRDMKVFADHAFIVSESSNHGMQVFDLRQLRGLNQFTDFSETTHYAEFGNAHNIAVNTETGYVFVVGQTQRVGYDPDRICDGGLHVIDVNDPANPTFVACFGEDGYVHDVQCTIYRGPDSRYTGHEICFGYNEDTLTLMDLMDHSNPTLISKMGYPTAAYTHQGWITEDHTVILLDDEADETSGIPYTATYIWDMTDLENPELMNTYYSSQTSIDHNQYISGDLTFQSNYEAGLRILHIDQANYDLTEVAWFDMYPDSTDTNFRGTWSNYPYFSNGMVASTSIDYGLFLQQPDYAAINAQIAAKKELASQTRYRAVEERDTWADCEHRSETRLCDATC